MRRAVYTFVLMTIITGSLFFSGCANRSRIVIVGSTSVQPIAEALAEGYMESHRDVNINVQGGGSSAGIKAIKDGTADIGTSSRPLAPAEQGKDLKPVTIAWDGIAIIVNSQNPVAGLTGEQIRGVFAGTIRNWSQVGGANRPIMVVNREEGSGTRTAFTELVMKETPLVAKTIVQSSTGAVRQTVAGNPDAIGYISLDAVNSEIKALAVDGVVCNAGNIQTKRYPITRPFLFIIDANKTDKAVARFVDFVLHDGQAIVIQNGLVSVK